MSDVGDFFTPVLLSLKISLTASIIVFIAGMAAAWRMSGASFPGKTWVETLIMLPMVLPPSVVGFILLIVFGGESPVGKGIAWLFHQSVVFTWWAGVIAAVTVAFPLAYQMAKNGFEGVEPDLKEAGFSMGANEWQVFIHITVPLAARSLIAAYLLGFTRALGEFGATLMIAGNIPGVTQTIPTAVYFAVSAGETGKAWAWVLTVVVISFITLLFVSGKKGSVFGRRV